MIIFHDKINLITDLKRKKNTDIYLPIVHVNAASTGVVLLFISDPCKHIPASSLQTSTVINNI